MNVEAAVETESKIKGHGNFLVSMANLGIFCTIVLGVALLASTYIPQDATGILAWLRDPESSSASNLTSKLLYGTSFLLLFFSLLMPLLALRNLGKVLSHGEAILTFAVADAFRRLAHSVTVTYLFCQIFAGILGFWASRIGGIKHDPSSYTFSDFVGWLFIYIVICVCLYSVAHLMKLAAEAADDSRSII